MQTFGRWLFRYRNRVFPLVILLLVAGFPPHLFRGSERADLVLDLAGILVALAGQALRTVVVGYAYIKRGGLNKRVHAESLVTTGLFGHSRNPLYVGNLLILLGLFMIHHNPWSYALGGAFFGLGYLAIVRTEEHYLAGKFGNSYLEYCRRVPRWWPRLTGIRATLGGMNFNLQRVLRKELPSASVWWLTALLLLVDEAWRAHLPSLGERTAWCTFAAVLAVGALVASRSTSHQPVSTPPLGH